MQAILGGNNKYGLYHALLKESVQLVKPMTHDAKSCNWLKTVGYKKLIRKSCCVSHQTFFVM